MSGAFGGMGGQTGGMGQERQTHHAGLRLGAGERTSLTILLPPRTKMVTARLLGVPSISSMRSRVVPNVISRTLLACPSLAAVSSCGRGTVGGAEVRWAGRGERGQQAVGQASRHSQQRKRGGCNHRVLDELDL